jgi:predicted AAA+ superfamily ATPase
MKRFAERDLRRWHAKSRRKPLVIRGARQVGKSTLVRNFAAQKGLKLHEVNLERHRELERVFKRASTDEVLRELAFACGAGSIRTEDSLLFLDEIQATPSALPFLRYLFEDMPGLAVISAGSLLEFTLARHEFSMPVGRIEYLFLGPMTFSEFLTARDESHLVDLIASPDPSPFPETAHERLLLHLRDYFLVGGMPEAVLTALDTGSNETISDVHASIVQTYLDDFGKYARDSQLLRLQAVFRHVPSNSGTKVVYAKIDRLSQARELKAAIDLLAKAQVITPAYHCDGNGLPLRSEIDPSVSKLYGLDIGLQNYICGTRHITLDQMQDRRFINEGAMAEQFCAQHLLAGSESNAAAELNYWLREGRTNNAEVDFLLPGNQSVIPVEVKAGKAGSLKSLHRFVYDKGCGTAVRLDLNRPSRQHVNVRFRLGAGSEQVEYDLISQPLYMSEYLPQLARNMA